MSGYLTKAWTQKFVRWYNQEHKQSGLKFVTPAQRHAGQAEFIMTKRKQLYAHTGEFRFLDISIQTKQAIANIGKTRS